MKPEKAKAILKERIEEVKNCIERTKLAQISGDIVQADIDIFYDINIKLMKGELKELRGILTALERQDALLRILKDGLMPRIGDLERREIGICCDLRGTGDLYPDTFIKLNDKDFKTIAKWLEEDE